MCIRDSGLLQVGLKAQVPFRFRVAVGFLCGAITNGSKNETGVLLTPGTAKKAPPPQVKPKRSLGLLQVALNEARFWLWFRLRFVWGRGRFLGGAIENGSKNETGVPISTFWPEERGFGFGLGSFFGDAVVS